MDPILPVLSILGYWAIILGYWAIIFGYWAIILGYWAIIFGYWAIILGYILSVFGYWAIILGSFGGPGRDLGRSSGPRGVRTEGPTRPTGPLLP